MSAGDEAAYAQAWNNFVLRCTPSMFEPGSEKRAAAIASMYSALAGNGGLNSFLTCAHEIAAAEVLDALAKVGAPVAARQFGWVLKLLREPLPPSTQDERWGLLERLWTDEIDELGLDVLGAHPDDDLDAALQRHVLENEAFYLSLEPGPTGEPIRPKS